jgi:hypothetical protein
LQEDHDKYKLIVDNDADTPNKAKAAKGMEDKYVAKYAAGGGNASFASVEKAAVDVSKAAITAYWTAYSNYKQAAALTAGIDSECSASTNCALLFNKASENTATFTIQKDYTFVLKTLYAANKTAIDSTAKTNYDTPIKAYGEKLA